MAIAVMQLVEQGKLDLDTDIGGLIDAPIKRAFDEEITLRHLLTHTAGFEDWGGQDVTVDPPQRSFGRAPPRGTRTNSITLAGRIVAEVSGQPFVEYVKQHVLEPTGMELATYQDSPFAPDVQERLASGITEANNYELSNNPSGSLTGLGADAARFLVAQLERSPKLLRAETWEQVWRAGLGEDSLGALAQSDPMGLGYFTGERNGHRFVGHGGSVPGFHSSFEIFPDDGVGIFVSGNGDGRNYAGARYVGPAGCRAGADFFSGADRRCGVALAGGWTVAVAGSAQRPSRPRAAAVAGCQVLVTVVFSQFVPALAEVWGRSIQLLQWIGVAAVVPAVWDLVNSPPSAVGGVESRWRCC